MSRAEVWGLCRTEVSERVYFVLGGGSVENAGGRLASNKTRNFEYFMISLATLV